MTFTNKDEGSDSILNISCFLDRSLLQDVIHQISDLGKKNNISYEILPDDAISGGADPRRDDLENLAANYGLTRLRILSWSDLQYTAKEVRNEVIPRGLLPVSKFSIQDLDTILSTAVSSGEMSSLICEIRDNGRSHYISLILDSDAMKRNPHDVRKVWGTLSNNHRIILERSMESSVPHEFISTWVRGFYSEDWVSSQHNKDIYSWSRSSADYALSIRRRFRIDSAGNVFATAYQPLNTEVNILPRKYAYSIGSIRENTLEDILSSNKASALAIKNDIFMHSEKHGCSDCLFFQGCRYNGVGLLRRELPDLESDEKCMGPMGLGMTFPLNAKRIVKAR